MQINVAKVLSEEEFWDILTSEEEGAPCFFDGNEDDWAKWIYSEGYRLVKLEKSK